MLLQGPIVDQSILLGKIVANLNTATPQAIPINATRYQLTGLLVESCTGNPQNAEGEIFNDIGGTNSMIYLYFPNEYPSASSSLFHPANTFNVARKNIQVVQNLYLIMSVLEGSAATCNIWMYGIRL